MHRYDAFLSLQQKALPTLLNPPLDVQAVWLAHIIRTDKYEKDCRNKFGTTIPCELLTVDFEKRVDQKATEAVWNKVEKDLPFSVSTLGKLFGSKSTAPPVWLSLQSCEVIKDRQWLMELRQQVGKNDPRNPEYVQTLIAAYEMLLYLHAKFPSSRTTPPVPIDLIWHTHMCHPTLYRTDIMRLLGKPDAMSHSPWPEASFYSRPPPMDFQQEFGITLDGIVLYPERLAALKLKRAVDRGQCTFRVTGRSYVPQQWFRCDTCRLNETKGCCAVCAKRCHAGHAVTLVSASESCFCDCPVVNGVNGGVPCRSCEQK